MPDDVVFHTRADIDQSVAQARKWASHPDNGWAPTREQVTVLADQVERLQAEVNRTSAAVHRATDRMASAKRVLRNHPEAATASGLVESVFNALDGTDA